MVQNRHSQRGIGFVGILLVGIVIAFLGLIALRVMPSISEYMAIRSTVEKIATNSPGTVAEIRTAFDRQAQIDTSITSVSGKDLTITKQSDRVVIGFAYEKEIELMKPVYLLIKYQGQSN